MQIVVQVNSLNLPYFPFFHKFLAFFYIQTFFYTIMNLFITLLENVNKSRTSANNVSFSKNKICRAVSCLVTKTGSADTSLSTRGRRRV
jgi:hypothetical protein